MSPLLNIAVRAARAAGETILQSLDQVDRINVDLKRRNDFVTVVDKAAEARIVDTLRQSYPHHAILAEETGLHGASDNDQRWIVDPLDGTTNFIHGLPHFAVSIGFQRAGRMEAAVIFNPVNQELYTAERGQGAYLNQRRLRVTTQPDLEGALLGTGLPYREDQDLRRYLATFKALYGEPAGVRRAGSAALDLAYVAAGRLDGYWEFGLRPWDLAAGVLLVREAGGFVGDFRGEEGFWDTGNILAANPKLFALMLGRIQRGLQPFVRPMSEDLEAADD